MSVRTAVSGEIEGTSSDAGVCRLFSPTIALVSIDAVIEVSLDSSD
jgi:hypothetical protein